MVRATIIAPKEYVGAVMSLCHEKRGVSVGMEYISTRRVQLTYDLPLAEIITDFFDALKSRTRGYASYDYEPRDYESADLVKVEVLVSGEVVDALSIIVHRDKAYGRGRALVEKLKELIPRQQFEVPVQAAVGKRIIARETVRAYRKDVTVQVLRRRHHAQAEAAREAEGRQAPDEAGGERRDSAGGLPRGAAHLSFSLAGPPIMIKFARYEAPRDLRQAARDTAQNTGALHLDGSARG